MISRQPSTTEYLPGMLHTASPAALLPAFPSWSLVCLGASSLYSHSAGLPEHLQPGFLPHTNYLIPWDCAVRMDAWRARTRKTPAHNLTVKIFIGFEYECPRGHRWVFAVYYCSKSSNSKQFKYLIKKVNFWRSIKFKSKLKLPGGCGFALTFLNIWFCYFFVAI